MCDEFEQETETLLSSRTWETELFIESWFATAKAWILECLFTFRPNFLLMTVRPDQLRQEARRPQFQHQ